MKPPTAIRTTAFLLALSPQASPQAAWPTLVEDIKPGPGGSSPTRIVQLGTKVVFEANDGVNGWEPWVSDGTEAGTFMLGDLEPPGSLGPYGFYQWANKVFFFTNPGNLWVTDGTTAGTVFLKGFVLTSSVPKFMGSAASTLFLAAEHGNLGRELWKTDGTPGGTVLVSDINTGPADSIQTLHHVAASLGNRLFFAADDGVLGEELWESDGTAAGTKLLHDINPGAASSDPLYLTAFTGRLWCRANLGALGTELFTIDTITGQVNGFDLYPGPAGSWPGGLTQWGDRVYFAAWIGATGIEPWAIDSSFALTSLGDLKPGSGSSIASPFGGTLTFKVVHTRIFFAADNGVHGEEPWSSDGTAAGTAMLGDLDPGWESSEPFGFLDVDKQALFVADVDGDQEIWRSDGTSAGTLPFWEISPNGNDNADNLVEAGSRVFVRATDGTSGSELFTFSSWLSGASYCTAGTSALGCTAALLADGVASRSQTDGFSVYTFKMEGQKDGIFFFGTNGRQAGPWGNSSSYQCVAPPVVRTPLRNSGGSANKCNGRHTLDFNDWMATNPLKAPVTGDVVQMQCWYRDPLNTSNQTTSFSRALEFTLYP